MLNIRKQIALLGDIQKSGGWDVSNSSKSLKTSLLKTLFDTNLKYSRCITL